jgi:hypothetical protein
VREEGHDDVVLGDVTDEGAAAAARTCPDIHPGNARQKAPRRASRKSRRFPSRRFSKFKLQKSVRNKPVLKTQTPKSAPDGPISKLKLQKSARSRSLSKLKL